jgi:tetratricopeptide (TPR) repeat protein
MLNPKSKIPNPKQILNLKSQIPKEKCFGCRLLGVWILFGVWCLVIGISQAYNLDLDKIKVNILKGDFKQAIVEGEKILSTQEEKKDLDELYYLLALSYLKDANYLRASDIFEIVMKEFPDSKFKDDAKLGLGDTFLLRGNLDKAQNSYEELLKTNPDTKLKAQVLHRLSQIGFKKGDTNQGKMYLEMLRQEFPANIELILNKDLYPIASPASVSGVTAKPILELYYTVQVGAFSKQANAENLVKKLSGEGYPAYSETISSQGKESYRVRVGKVSSRQEAVILAEKLSQEGYPTKIFP